MIQNDSLGEKDRKFENYKKPLLDRLQLCDLYLNLNSFNHANLFLNENL